jgi:hypothetical protein
VAHKSVLHNIPPLHDTSRLPLDSDATSSNIVMWVLTAKGSIAVIVINNNVLIMKLS